MVRVKRGVITRRRHKNVISQAKGFYGGRSRLYREAKMAVIKSKSRAYVGRRLQKRNTRSLWIVRINAALDAKGISYSRFMNMLRMQRIDINRKMLAELAATNEAAFQSLVATVTK